MFPLEDNTSAPSLMSRRIKAFYTTLATKWSQSCPCAGEYRQKSLICWFKMVHRIHEYYHSLHKEKNSTGFVLLIICWWQAMHLATVQVVISQPHERCWLRKSYLQM